MKLKQYSFRLFLLLFATILFSCIGTKDYVRTQTDLYKSPGKDKISMRFAVTHIDEKFSFLHYEINSSQLSLKKKNESDSLGQTSLKITFRLFRRYGENLHNDTANFIIRENANERNTKLINGQWKIRLQQGYDWVMEIQALDIISGKRGSFFLEVNKENNLGPQNFDVRLPDSSVIFSPYFTKKTGLKLRLPQNNNQSTLRIDFFKTAYPAALPPTVEIKQNEIKYVPDSTFFLSKKSDYFPLIADRLGTYHCRMDSVKKDGLSIFRTDAEFPEVKTFTKMVQCAVYIMKDEEFNEAVNNPDKRAAVDKFWLKLGGSSERAASLISAYYSRVKEANVFFSSYLDGWKTDRGMIWIIYGQPKLVLKTANQETWSYGDDADPNPLSFTFRKMKNVFSENDYALDRENFKAELWYRAVDTWRQGRVNNGK